MQLPKLFKDKVASRVVMLTALGVFLVCFRVMGLGFPILPDDKIESWHVEMKFAVDAGGASEKQPVRIKMFLPQTTRGYAIVDENFITNGYGITTHLNEKTTNRFAEWTRQNDHQKRQFYYRAILYKTQAIVQETALKGGLVDAPVVGSAIFNTLAEKDVVYRQLGLLIDDLKTKFVTPEQMVIGLQQMIEQGKSPSLIKLIREHFDPQSNAALIVQILRHAGLPVRVANGVELGEDRRQVNLEQRLELYEGGQWVTYNAKTQHFSDGGNWLVWWVGQAPIIQTQNANVVESQISYKRHVENQLTEAIWKGNPVKELAYKFSVFSLPVDVQILFVSLFMLPLGALVVAIIRQTVGIVTFGTFMPVLVALALRETSLLAGILMFSFVIFLGTVTRGYLSKLQLLMVPRLAAILVVVVGFIYLLSILSFMSGLYEGLSMPLFPIVILTMMIERVSITIEESGLRDAMIASAGSLFVAVISYMVMTNHYVIYWVSTFPELLLIVLACCLALGRYNGYKLMEYYRFRMIRARNVKP